MRGGSDLGRGDLFGVSRGLRAGRWGSTRVRGWGDLGQNPKTELLGLSFRERITGGLLIG